MRSGYGEGHWSTLRSPNHSTASASKSVTARRCPRVAQSTRKEPPTSERRAAEFTVTDATHPHASVTPVSLGAKLSSAPAPEGLSSVMCPAAR
jgi:hypothetical protein